jgi:hypothetical protein
VTRRKIIFAEVEQAKRDEQGIDIEMPDGAVFSIDSPLFWPDGWQKAEDKRTLAAAVLGGEDRLAAFEAAGGTATMLDAILGDVLLQKNTSLGESPASSS